MNCLKLIPVYIVYIVSLVISEAQMPPLEQPEKRREGRNREKRRRKAIEARLRALALTVLGPSPVSLTFLLVTLSKCSGWVSQECTATLCLHELGLLFQRSWQSSPAFTARCYEGDPARHCRHAPSHSQPLAWGIVSEESILGNTFLSWFVLFLLSEDWFIAPMPYHFTARESRMNFAINFKGSRTDC